MASLLQSPSADLERPQEQEDIWQPSTKTEEGEANYSQLVS